MGTKERRERERLGIRQSILEAARELFVSEGYDAVTMRKVATRIEYSPTAIYLHFSDKDALMRELCTSDFRALAGKFMRIAAVSDPVERLRKAGEAYLAFGSKSPGHYRLMFMTPHPPVGIDATEIEKGNPDQDAYAYLFTIVSECIASGRFRDADPELVAQTIWAGVHGVVALEIAKGNDPWISWRPFTRRGRSMVELLIDGHTSTSPSKRPAAVRRKKD